MLQCFLHRLGRILVILQPAVEIILIRDHVEVAVTGQVEGDNPLLAALPGRQRFVDGDFDGVG